MKIAIIGAGTVGLNLAAHVAQRAAKSGIEAEVREPATIEERNSGMVEAIEVAAASIEAVRFRQIPREEIELNRRKAYDYLF